MRLTSIGDLVDALERRGGDLAGWHVRAIRSTSRQRLFAGTGSGLVARQVRRVEEQGLRLTLRVPLDGALGVAGIDVDPLAPVDETIARCMAAATGSRNPPWVPPGPPSTPYPVVATADPEVASDPDAAMRRLEERLSAAMAAEPGVRFDSAEVYVTASEREVRTSTGAAFTEARTVLDLEVAAEPLPGPNHLEVHDRIASVSQRDLDVEAFVATTAEEARRLGHTVPPPPGTFPVLLHRRPVAHLLTCLVEALDAHRIHSRTALFAVGDPVSTGPRKVDGDALVIDVDPTIPGLVRSRAATFDGQIPTGGRLVDDGVVRAIHVDTRFGQYLGLESNHLCGNVVVARGRRTTAELLADHPGTLEVITFAGLTVSPRLTWSSEIRLARLHRPDGTTLWVKGGIVSGDLRANLSDCSFSSEVVRLGEPGGSVEPDIGYVGPEAVLLRAGVSVAGG